MLTTYRHAPSFGKLLLPSAALGAALFASTPFFAQTTSTTPPPVTPAATPYNNTIFGPNVYVFDPSVPGATINGIFANRSDPRVAIAQFAQYRTAVLFKPGTYSGVSDQVGFNTSIAGLGLTPDSTILNGGGLYIDVTDSGGNVTTNFWRSLENLQIPVPAGGVDRWAVSQGTSFRRVHIAGGPLELANQQCGYASGGFLADSVIDGTLQACSQQQWYTRNSTIGNFTGAVWNYVFSGVNGAPAQGFGNAATPYTTLPTTPIVREKPYLYVDGAGAYNVFVPSLKTASSGPDITANGGLGVGSSLPISSFFIANPSNSAQTINSALAGGKNLILTPGIYQLSAPINVTRANTIVLGLGYATLVPTSGNSVMTVADVDGVQLADLLIDAGPANSPVLLQVGVAGSTRANHSANPTSVDDVYFRIGGATTGTATTSLELDSNNVILDNVWAWRADHGATPVGWTVNTAAHGVVVNGDNVTALGLAVEHYQQSQTVWNGNNGETIFYQSEDPYDPPSQAAWMDGSMNGYPSYEVAATVCNHTAYGVGVYSFFNQGVNIIQDNAIHAPNTSGINFHDMVTVKLTGSGDINSIINGIGGPANQTSGPNDLVSYSGTGTCPTQATGTAVHIDAGGGAVAPYVADTDFVGGGHYAVGNAVDTTKVVNPAPQAVYQSEHEGVTTYTIPGFSNNSAHTVRLHFAELYFSTAGSRKFNVAINGAQVLTDFDVVQTAGGRFIANIQQFAANANGSGQIVISLTNGSVNQPILNGIEIQ